MNGDADHHTTSKHSPSGSSSETENMEEVPPEYHLKDPSIDQPGQFESQSKSAVDVRAPVSAQSIPTPPDNQCVSIASTEVREAQKLRDFFAGLIHQRECTSQPLTVATSVEASNSSLSNQPAKVGVNCVPQINSINLKSKDQSAATKTALVDPSLPPVRHQQQQHPPQALDSTIANQDIATLQPRHNNTIRSDQIPSVGQVQITAERMRMIPLFRGDIDEDGNEWILNADRAFCVWGWEENNTMKCNYIRHCLRDRALINYEKLFDDKTRRNWKAFVAAWQATYPASASTAATAVTPMAALREFQKPKLDAERLLEQVYTADGKVYWEIHEFARKLLIVGASVSCISEIGMGMKGYLMLPPVVQEELPKYDPRAEPTLQQLYEDLTSLDCARLAGKLREKEYRERRNWRLWAGLICLFILLFVAVAFWYGMYRDRNFFV